jgi:S-adenosylmethionine synthetase
VSEPSGYTFTSESVSEGHPDKVCDYIADSILDAYLEQDPHARVACEVLCKSNLVVLAGEITSDAKIDREAVARRAIEEVGYTDVRECFNASNAHIQQNVTQQSADIKRGVDAQTAADHEQGAGDQGIMFGYATDETPELLPLPIVLAHKLTRGLAEDRRSGRYPWLRPDAKAQVSVRYEHGRPTAVRRVLVSTQHAADVDQPTIREYVVNDLAPRALNGWHTADIHFDVNPTGSFVIGGPTADAGVTGRKIIVDTYGGVGRHGGGAFSGKDPSKVDRSGAYFCRHVARRIVKSGIAKRTEVQVAYAIGLARPVSIRVDTFGSGDSRAAEEFVEREFDFRPASIIDCLSLLRPIYRQTTNYGHFGKAGLPWEE